MRRRRRVGVRRLQVVGVQGRSRCRCRSLRRPLPLLLAQVPHPPLPPSPQPWGQAQRQQLPLLLSSRRRTRWRLRQLRRHTRAWLGGPVCLSRRLRRREAGGACARALRHRSGTSCRPLRNPIKVHDHVGVRARWLSGTFSCFQALLRTCSEIWLSTFSLVLHEVYIPGSDQTWVA